MRRFPLLLLLLLTASTVSFGQGPKDPKRMAKDFLLASLQKNDANEAIRDLDQAVSFDIEFVPAYVRRGQLYEEKKDASKAMENYTQALELILISRGKLKFADKQLDSAIEDYELAIKLAPKAPQGLGVASRVPDRVTSLAYYYSGLTYAEKEDYDKAVRNFTSAINLNGDFPEALYSMGLAKSLQDDLPGAIEDTKKAIAQKKNFIEAYQSLELFYHQSRNWQDAQVFYREALRKNPGDPDLIHSLGIAFLEDERGDKFDLAHTNLQHAAEMKPDDAGYMSDVGWALFKLNKLQDARVQLEKASAKDPSNALTHERLGDVYVSLKDINKARTSFEKALDLIDDNDREHRNSISDKLRQLDNADRRRR
jgi:tetratricopeptide (TPR) repeat protein